MLTQFPNISSWRKEEFSINPYDVYTLNFRDTNPNIFIVGNPNQSTLKIGLSAVPRSNSYEFKLEPNTTETFGRPIGSNNLYILNDSSITVKITVFSMEGDFNPQILKNTNVNIDVDQLQASTIITGFGDGISLDVYDSSVTSELQKLIKSSSVSGYTNLYNLLAELQTIISKFDVLNSNSVVSGHTNLFSVLNSLSNLNETLGYKIDLIYSQMLGVNNNIDDNFLNNVTEFSYTAENDCTIIFKWLTNDGGSESQIKIGDNTVFTMLVDESFTDMSFNLKAGDVISIESEQPLFRINYHIISGGV